MSGLKRSSGFSSCSETETKVYRLMIQAFSKNGEGTSFFVSCPHKLRWAYKCCYSFRSANWSLCLVQEEGTLRFVNWDARRYEFVCISSCKLHPRMLSVLLVFSACSQRSKMSWWKRRMNMTLNVDVEIQGRVGTSVEWQTEDMWGLLIFKLHRKASIKLRI